MPFASNIMTTTTTTTTTTSHIGVAIFPFQRFPRKRRKGRGSGGDALLFLLVPASVVA